MNAATRAAAGMDRHYRYQRHIYDLTRRCYLLGRDTLIDGLVPPDNGAVVEIGCGTARNLVRAARCYPDARLFGMDVSSAMLDTARTRVCAGGAAGRVHLAQGDATTLDVNALFGLRQVDRIYISYALSMIPGWQTVLDRACAALAPQGSLHVLDFGRCEALPTFVGPALYAWLARFSVEPRQDLRSVLEATAVRHNLDCFFTTLYRGYAAYGVLTRH